jgi:hypothetical protein
MYHLSSVIAVGVLLAALQFPIFTNAADNALPSGVKVAANTPKKAPAKPARKRPVSSPTASSAPSTATPVATPRASTTTTTTAVPEDANAGAASKAEFTQGLKNFSLSYTGILEGGLVSHLDGQEGPGSNLYWRHAASLGYKFHPNFKFSLGQEVWSYLGANPTTNPNYERLVYKDPTATLSASSLLSSPNGFSMPGYARYYFPFSKSSAKSYGTQNDVFNGQLRLQVVPTQMLMGDKLELSFLTRFQYRFAGVNQKYASLTKTSAGKVSDSDPNKPRIDYYLLFIPNIGYAFHDLFQPYAQLQMATYHNREGGYTRILTDPDNGAVFELGFSSQVTPKLQLNPYVDFGASDGHEVPQHVYTMKTATYGFLLSYAIL